MTELRLAFGFLTALPVRPDRKLERGELGRAAIWFPWVGLSIGALLWLVRTAVAEHYPAGLSAGLIVALWASASGGLHLDGLADCCDGLFASAPPSQRLEILKDVHVGALGVIGLLVLLLLKTAAVASLADARALLLAPLLGRWWLLPLARMRPARLDGLGARLHNELPTYWALPLPLLIGFLVPFGWRGAAAFVLSGVTTLLWGRLARARLGGQTGDVLGAVCETGELASLLVFAWS
ncbi:MAG TPA: adenosylcobinamide-GDP ribazoletransferase [Anaerolineales bacterium]|nr:adenosylcobinamide-GDP ribazoletransferase [Anaerolineales bacterium]